MQKDFIEGEEALAAAELWELPNRYSIVQYRTVMKITTCSL